MVVIDREIVILSKLLPPEVKKQSIHRERLVKLLSENADKKLIILNAGPGYGKTTLLAHYLQKAGAPYLFYRLDKTDSNASVFISYLVAGLRKYHRNFGRRTISILGSTKNPSQHLDIIAGTLINEFMKLKKRQFFMVFDDYHNAEGSGQISELMAFFLHHSPPSLHFIIASRKLPMLPLTQARIRNELFVLSNDDLKFDKRDISELYIKTANKVLSSKELSALERYSEGWITCLQLVLQSPDAGQKRKRSLIPYLSSLRSLTDYPADYFNLFAHDVFDNEPDHIRTFMLECSFMDWLNADACKYLTGRRDAAQILKNFEERNAFLFKVSTDSFRWHRLFQDFLKFMARKTGRSLGIIQRTADYLMKKGFLEVALPLYIDAHQCKKTVTIIKRIGDQMVNSGKSSLLLSHLNRLPQKIRDNDPDLLMQQAYAYMLDGNNEDAFIDLKRAINLYRSGQKARKNLSNAYYMMSSVYFNTGRYDAAREWLVKSLKLSSKKIDLQRAAILNGLGLLYSRMAGKKLQNAIDCFRRAFDIVKKIPENEGLEASILHNWSSVERKAGNILSAYDKSQKAADLLTREGNFSPQCGAIFYNAARFSAYLGNMRNALQILRSGGRISRQFNDICSAAIIERGYAMIHEEKDEFALAKDLYLKALHKFENLHIDRMVLVAHGDLSRICTKLGLFAEAKRHLSQVWTMKKTKNDAEAIPILAIEAKLRINQGELDTAEGLFDRVLDLSSKFGLNLEKFTALLEIANILEKKNCIPEALDALKQAIALSDKMDYDKILNKSLKEKPGLIRLLNRIEAQHGQQLLVVRNLPFHLVRVFMFGVPQVMIDGKTIPPAAWKTTSSFRLFCYLCVHHGKPVSRDIIIETIWKDTAPKKGSFSLRKASQHVRNAIYSALKTKDDPIVYRNKMYQLADNYSAHIDAEEFMSLMNETGKLPDGHPDFKKNLIQALNIYKSDFATGWIDEWITTNRDEYRHYYETCLNMLADHCSRKNEIKEAAVYYKKLTVCNFYEETYHKKLWLILARLNRYNEIKRDFEQLEQIYKNELKIGLQPETVELYRSLFKNL